MSILSLQRRLHEIGHIRLGDKGPKGEPRPIGAFRLTSQDERVLRAAAALPSIGGEVRPWEAMPGHFELYTEAQELDVLVAPMPIDQWYEQWTSGGCTHRCDGETNQITDGACSCDLDDKAAMPCKLTTRVWLMLPELPSLGTWRLETHGYYAAVELPQSVEMLQTAQARGVFIPARLAIEAKTVKRDGKTLKFGVPTLRLCAALGSVIPIAGRAPSALAPIQDELPMTNGHAALPAPDQEASLDNHTTSVPAESVERVFERTGWGSPQQQAALKEFKALCAVRCLDWKAELVRMYNAGLTALSDAERILTSTVCAESAPRAEYTPTVQTPTVAESDAPIRHVSNLATDAVYEQELSDVQRLSSAPPQGDVQRLSNDDDDPFAGDGEKYLVQCLGRLSYDEALPQWRGLDVEAFGLRMRERGMSTPMLIIEAAKVEIADLAEAHGKPRAARK